MENAQSPSGDGLAARHVGDVGTFGRTKNVQVWFHTVAEVAKSDGSVEKPAEHAKQHSKPLCNGISNDFFKLI